ncbi:MAG: glutathione S-transferase family protein [Myxococcales bacterium]|nr:glutathione S-transferase family protein [Myxococcales bacterium]
MAKPKLSYFDFPGGRGEDCRLAFFMANVDFEDDRIPFAQWADRKADTPFGSLPVLEIEGKGKLAQSNAILAYLGRTHELHPSDPWDAARHEALMAAVEDVRAVVIPTLSIEDEDEKRRAREQLAQTALQTWGARLEAQIAGPFVAGDTLHVVDLKLFVLVKWFAKGAVDYVPTDVFSAFPKLMALYEAVGAHERVKAWYARA